MLHLTLNGEFYLPFWRIEDGRDCKNTVVSACKNTVVSACEKLVIYGKGDAFTCKRPQKWVDYRIRARITFPNRVIVLEFSSVISLIKLVVINYSVVSEGTWGLSILTISY